MAAVMPAKAAAAPPEPLPITFRSELVTPLAVFQFDRTPYHECIMRGIMCSYNNQIARSHLGASLTD